MANEVQILLLTVLLTVSALATLAHGQSNCATFTISHSCLQSEDDCRSIQDGLQEVASWDPVSPPHDCVDLNLSPGEYVLSSPVAINSTNITFRLQGSGEASTFIRCAEGIVFTVNHTINLNSLYSVSIMGVSVYGCDRPIRISNTRNVSISQSLFSSFSFGALDVYNSFEVTVTDTTFLNSTGRSQIRDAPFRGNAGGISIATHFNSFANPIITIRNCTFIGNRADPLESNVVSSSEVISGQNLLTGRGGGLRIYIGTGSLANARVEDCYFERNYARSYGGGMYIALHQDSDHYFELGRSQFVNNEAGDGGGGLIVAYPATSQATPFVSIAECNFTLNRATYGGGVYVFPHFSSRFGVNVTFTSCAFEFNRGERYGAAIGLLSADVFLSTDRLNPYIVEDCKFYNNTGSRAAILEVIYSPLLMKGRNEFTNNIGPCLRVVGSEMTVAGILDFTENSAEGVDGGALYILSYGQVVMQKGSQMNFIGNNGSLGSAIVVESRNVANTLSRVIFNPLCFLRYGANATAPPFTWEEVSINFTRNSALIGPAAYINQLELCAWDQIVPRYSIYEINRVLKWPFVHLTGDNVNLGHPDSQANNASLYLQTPPVGLNLSSPYLGAPPGRPLNLPLQLVDELDNPTSAIVRIESGYSFRPNVITFNPKSESETARYAVSSDDFVVNSNVTLSDAYSYSVRRERLTINVPFVAEECPAGYLLRNRTITQGKDCQCNIVDNPFLMRCEPDGETFILEPHIWISIDADRRSSLQSYRCPTDYCRRVYNTSLGVNTYSSVFVTTRPDAQCACNRSGILCGDCPAGYGFSSLRNRCVTCGSVHVVLIFILIVFDLLICVGIVVMSKSLPVWVYPCLFYVQIAPYITESFPLDFTTVHGVLYYVSSALSLYFPYDFCLYAKMSAQVSYLLRYLPLFTVIPTGILTLIAKHKKLKTLLPKVWYGVWILIILMYTQVVHTSMSILNCPLLHTYKSRWYINGNVECFKGGHAALAILAIIVLLFAVLLIPVIAIVSWKLPKSSKWWRVLVPPLTNAFKSNLYWWGSVELARRFLLLLFTITFPGKPIASAFVLMISTAVYLFVQPYSSLFANVLETLLSLDILIILIIASNEAVTEFLLTVGSQLQSSVSELQTCPSPVIGVTKLTALMTPFYYLPLLILFCGVLISAFYYLWTLGKHCKQKAVPKVVSYTRYEEAAPVQEMEWSEEPKTIKSSAYVTTSLHLSSLSGP